MAPPQRVWHGLLLVFICIASEVCGLYGISPLDVDFFRGDETKYKVLLIDKNDERMHNPLGALIQMTSPIDKKKYDCIIPLPLDEQNKDEVSEENTPVISKLLQPLGVSCLYRIEGWWTYEFCYGKHVRQFHQERDKPIGPKDEYFLGKWVPGTEGLENKGFYSETYTDGTPCDINGQPRTAEVQFFCENDVHRPTSFISEIKEPSSCRYLVTVSTPLMCKHPTYKPKKEKVQSIYCIPSGSSTLKKEEQQEDNLSKNQVQAEPVVPPRVVLEKDILGFNAEDYEDDEESKGVGVTEGPHCYNIKDNNRMIYDTYGNPVNKPPPTSEQNVKSTPNKRSAQEQQFLQTDSQAKPPPLPLGQQKYEFTVEDLDALDDIEVLIQKILEQYPDIPSELLSEKVRESTREQVLQQLQNFQLGDHHPVDPTRKEEDDDEELDTPGKLNSKSRQPSKTVPQQSSNKASPDNNNNRKVVSSSKWFQEEQERKKKERMNQGKI